jgi:hypothetical protein
MPNFRVQVTIPKGVTAGILSGTSVTGTPYQRYIFSRALSHREKQDIVSEVQNQGRAGQLWIQRSQLTVFDYASEVADYTI